MAAGAAKKLPPALSFDATPVMSAPRRFCLVLVKPSHYDDDGYVIQWFRSAIPSNSLAALYGLARDCAARRILGDTELDIHPIDETNTRVRPERTVVEARRLSAAATPSTTAGQVAARWWIDDATGLLLWFESYDDGGRAAVVAGFTRLTVREPEVADHVPPRMFVPLTTTSLTLSATTTLEELGWACPDQLAGLTLVRLRTDVIDRPSVIHMAYSDGLSTVSVFEQRGSLEEEPRGEWRGDLGAWVSEGSPSLASWQSGETVFTVVTDGSSDLLAGVVRALPHESAVATTTMDRIQAGWARILALVTG
jgi:hypothetical protein